MALRKKKKKLPKLKTLRNKAWHLFSIWVRSQGADFQGRVACYTCGRLYPSSELNSGHYRHDSHDFDPRNVKAQCVACNLYESGRSDEFYLHLIRDYGIKVADELRKRAKWNAYSREELMQVIQTYGTTNLKTHKS